MGPQKRLNDYLKEVADRPFKWGEHDCLIFSNEAWRRMHGHGWADDWLGRYMKPNGRPMNAMELRSEYGHWDFAKAVDTKLRRIEYVPPRGALVATKQVRRWSIGLGLGICNGIKCAFLSAGGVIYLPVDTIDKAWVDA